MTCYNCFSLFSCVSHCHTSSLASSTARQQIHSLRTQLSMGLFDIFKKDGKGKPKHKGPKTKSQKRTTNKGHPKAHQQEQQSQAASSAAASQRSPAHHSTSPAQTTPPPSPRSQFAREKATGRNSSKSPARSEQSFDLERELATPHLEPSCPVTSVYQKTYDCIAFILHCPSHGKVGVARSPTEAIWLPYVQKHKNMSWYDSAKEGAMQVLAEGSASRFEAYRRKTPFDQMLLLEVARVQMPSTNKFVARYIFYVRLNLPSADENGQPGNSPTSHKNTNHCCTDTARLQWLALDFISQGFIRNCWGPELVELARLVMEATKTTEETGSPPVFRQRLQEQSVEQLFDILPRPDESVQSDSHLESLKKIKTNKNDIERLFADFLDHCYPSFYMTYDSFRHYLSRNGFEKDEKRLKRFFRAFNRASNGYLSFNELLQGLICMERETPHVEFRIRFVFNYYDTRSRTVLVQEDFCLMVADMANVDKHGRAVTYTEGQLQRKAAEAMACFKTKTLEVAGEEGSSSVQVVTFAAFLQGVGSHAFRGTSNLCRSKCNVFGKINRRIAARAVKMNSLVAKGRLTNIVTKKHYHGSCQSCRSKKYKVASHLTLVGLDGYLLAEGAEELQLQVPPQPSELSPAENAASPELSVSTFTTEPRTNVAIEALKLMAAIRKYNESKQRTPSAGFGPGRSMNGLMTAPNEREQLVRLMRALAAEIIPLLANEPRCKPVTSPTYIIGDIHGNLEDLLSMERTLWRRFPEVNGMHYLFLGDYVDRGRWSVECALYLIAMKVLRPKNVTLLRGNHEVRDIQIKYTYYNECRAKYGEQHGQEVWTLSNRIFDHLPLCAVVDENVYCAHGGLPYSAQTIEEINVSIPVELSNPEQECDVAWEIMWSDPMAPEMFREAIQLLDSEQVDRLRPGFIFNSKRATAFFFNDQGAATFLADNQLTHIIRAHEVPKFGFLFHFNFKCTTIFSCSHYCGNDNDCAVVFVDGPWMRLIRIDTSANISATD